MLPQTGINFFFWQYYYYFTFFFVVDFERVSLQVGESSGSKGGLDSYSKTQYNHTNSSVLIFTASTCKNTFEGIPSYFVDL